MDSRILASSASITWMLSRKSWITASGACRANNSSTRRNFAYWSSGHRSRQLPAGFGPRRQLERELAKQDPYNYFMFEVEAVKVK